MHPLHFLLSCKRLESGGDPQHNSFHRQILIDIGPVNGRTEADDFPGLPLPHRSSVEARIELQSALNLPSITECDTE